MAELRLRPHAFKNGAVVEVWADDEFIAQITEGPGRTIRVLSKHELAVDFGDPEASYAASAVLGTRVNVLEVSIR